MFNSGLQFHPSLLHPRSNGRSPSGQPPMFPNFGNMFPMFPQHPDAAVSPGNLQPPWRPMQSPLAAFPSPSKYINDRPPGSDHFYKQATSTPSRTPKPVNSDTSKVHTSSILFDPLPATTTESSCTEDTKRHFSNGIVFPEAEDTIQSLLNRALASNNQKRAEPSLLQDSVTPGSKSPALGDCSEPEQARICQDVNTHKSPSVESITETDPAHDASFLDREDEFEEDLDDMDREQEFSQDSFGDEGIGDEEDYGSLMNAVEPNPEGLFFCHLCDFTGSNREDFSAHMSKHYEYQCPKCDYKSRTEGRLKRHIKDFHSDVPPENYSGKPSVRSGRPKIHRCKQCPFVAQDKVDFWAHARTHIKEDKILECPKCEFVTEYKHHLEYHIRNHFGSKPFKCSKCNYQCVNKSMLNSHMKSHTNVYQYRCLECNYATKYCHSLKQHLKKYQHRPATILNADGSLPDPDTAQELLSLRLGSKLVTNQLPPTSNHQPTNFMPPGWPLPHAFFTANFPPLGALRPPMSFPPPLQPQRLPVLDHNMPLDLTSKGGRSSSEQSSGSPDISFSTTPHSHFKKRMIEQISETQTGLLKKACFSLSEEHSMPTDLRCRFCAIRFEDPLMFDIHMGYHGYDKPFKCNRCGTEAQDKMEFFIHLNRTAHP